MNTQKFTPGPWEADFYYLENWPNRYATSHIAIMADCEDWKPEGQRPKRVGITIANALYTNQSSKETKANARLIAASPEMYYCLKELKAALVDNVSKSYSEARFDYEMAVEKMKIIIKNVEG